MTIAAVTVQELDLSLRIPSFPGVYGGIVIPSPKGRIGQGFLATSDAALLSEFTENGELPPDADMAFYSALAFLEKSDKLWVSRAAHLADTKYGGVVFKELLANASWAEGVLASDIEERSALTDELFSIYAKDPGEWNNNLAVKLLPYHQIDQVTVSGDVLMVANDWYKGERVRLTATAISGTTINTSDYYYVAPAVSGVTCKGTSLKLYTTRANAIAGTNAVASSAFVGATGLALNPIDYCRTAGASKLEVYKDPGTGTYGLVETFTISTTPGARDGYGNIMYLESVLSASAYIRGAMPKVDGNVDVDLVGVVPTPTTMETSGFLALDGGAYVAAELADRKDAASIFDGNSYPMIVLMDGGYTDPEYQTHISDLAESRGDCVAFLSCSQIAEKTIGDPASAVVDAVNNSGVGSSYAAFYSPHVKVTDRYGVTRYVSPDGYAAAALAYTAYSYELWYPVGGNKRGKVNAADLLVRYTKGQADYLYDNNVNPLMFKVGRGIRIWGQKTAYRTPSALDRLNVRLLCVVIEPAMKETLEDFLFDLNDQTSRNLAKIKIESYMQGVQARRGVTSFRVVCDSTNNLETDIANNIMRVDLYINPTRSIEEIPLRVVISASDVSVNVNA